MPRSFSFVPSAKDQSVLCETVAEHPGRDRQCDSGDDRKRQQFRYQQAEPRSLEIDPMRDVDGVAQWVDVREILKNCRHAADRRGETGQKRERSEEHTSELQSPYDLVCRLL